MSPNPDSTVCHGTDTGPVMFWRAPSGRIHGMKNCSANGAPHRSVEVELTDEELDSLSRNLMLCRCVRRKEPR